MAKTIQIKLPKLHEAQRQIIDESKRFNVACCGRRIGKTMLALDISINGLIEGKRIAFFEPTYKMMRDVWNQTNNLALPIIKAIEKQMATIETITGGEINFWSMDAYDSIRGKSYDIVIIDEAAMCRNLEEAWTQAIRPTLIDRQGSGWFFSTPKGHNYFRTLNDNATGEHWQRWQMPTHRNPYIPKEELIEFQNTMLSSVYQQEILAQFIQSEGAIIKRNWVQYTDIDSTALDIYMGVDLAISGKALSDYTAIGTIGKDKQGNVYILDVVRDRKPFNQVLEMIKQAAAKWKPRLIAIENVQYQAAVIQELARTTNLPIVEVRPDRDKVTRFQPLATRYEQGLVYHSRGLPAAFENELLSFPDSEHDDQIDALAYAYAMGGKGSLKIIDWNKL